LNRYVVDAWAWVEYLIGSKYGVKLKEVLDEDGSEVYTCAITLAEVISKVAQEGRNVQEAYAMLFTNSQIVNANEELSLQAGILHCEMRKTQKDFGLADAYVWATARRLNSKILTGDMHFKNVKNAVLTK
jgi:predicted nucleic acid-binding protein